MPREDRIGWAQPRPPYRASCPRPRTPQRRSPDRNSPPGRPRLAAGGLGRDNTRPPDRSTSWCHQGLKGRHRLFSRVATRQPTRLASPSRAPVLPRGPQACLTPDPRGPPRLPAVPSPHSPETPEGDDPKTPMKCQSPRVCVALSWNLAAGPGSYAARPVGSPEHGAPPPSARWQHVEGE